MRTVGDILTGITGQERGEVCKPGEVCNPLRNDEDDHAVEARVEPCKVCGTGIQYQWRGCYPFLKPTVCDKCYEALERDRKHDEQIALLPYQKWDFKIGNNTVLKSILISAFGETRPSGEFCHSLYINGRTGLCKTRAVCEAAARYIRAGGSVCYKSCHKAMARYSELLGQSMTSAKAYTNESCAFKGLLILDDLGVGTITERSLEWMFAVIDERLSGRKPTWITSNYNYDRLIKWITRADPEYAERIVRRISDLCKTVEAVECTENKPKE